MNCSTPQKSIKINLLHTEQSLKFAAAIIFPLVAKFVDF